MSKTPITDKWKKEWAGESPYMDPIVQDGIEVMAYLETRTNDQECECSAFLDAQKACTDNEGYGALIRAWNGSWLVGCGLPPIAFCPWCGKPTAKPA